MKELEKLNDLLTFADDSCITTENMFDLRKAINCLDLELRKLGVKLNPMKSQIMTNIKNFDKPEIESIEVGDNLLTVVVKVDTGHLEVSVVDTRDGILLNQYSVKQKKSIYNE